VATQRDLDLAQRLIATRLLGAERLKAAFELQSRLEQQGRPVGIERVLYHLKLLRPGSLDAALAPSPLVAQPFPGYRLLARVGEGGSSAVYRGVYEANGHPVAVKVLDPVQALRADFVERFRTEAELLIRFEHENIVLGYEVGEVRGLHYFTMDFVDGATVLEVVERRGWLSNAEALSLTLQAARALHYLHEQGFLHRDVKPGNLMVEPGGRLRVIDLGLIRRLGEYLAGEEETTVGTVEYVSPEQARGRSDLDPRSDIYSLGITLYHMVVGEVPFQGETDYEVMAKQVLSSLDAQKVKQRRVSPEVQYFITKMTTKDRESRFETVADVIAGIEGYVAAGLVPVDLGPAPAPPPPAAAPIRRAAARPAASPPAASPPAPQPAAPPAVPPQAPAPPAGPTSAPVPRRLRERRGDEGHPRRRRR